MITTMMNQKGGLADIISCPAMEIPGHRTTLLKSGAKEKHQLNAGGPNKGQETPAPTKFYVGASIESDARPTGVQLQEAA